MTDYLVSMEQSLMIALNMSGQHSIFMNETMWLVSKIVTWIPLYVTILYVQYIRDKKNWWKTILLLILIIVLTDQLSSGLLKPLVCRPRPSHEPGLMDMLEYVNGYKGGPYGFPSSHAANMFALATYMMYQFKEKTLTTMIFIMATIVSYSRIYLGVHYPTDILVGTMIGIFISATCCKLYEQKIANTSFKADTRPIRLILSLSFALIVIYSITQQINS